ncbi:MAG: hypothetical protein NVSMB32_12860 [Actinomycetota bacterium]
MHQAESTILLFGDDQFPLLEMEWALGLAIAQLERYDTHEPAVAPIVVLPGQLSFGPNQMLVWDVDPEPEQPTLLSPPALWEMEPSEPGPRPARPRRPRRSRQTANPSEQLTLFS